MSNTVDITGYRYLGSKLNHSHDYLLPTVLDLLSAAELGVSEKRLFELGCGNGSVANLLTSCGWEVTGVDPSSEGIKHAKEAYPELRLETGSAYDDLCRLYGQYPVVLSLEVVEHVYAPRDYARTLFDLTRDGG